MSRKKYNYRGNRGKVDLLVSLVDTIWTSELIVVSYINPTCRYKYINKKQIKSIELPNVIYLIKDS